MKTKIYISGKITGDPDYKTKFANAQEYYETQGYTVLNPAVFPADLSNADYTRICFAMLDTADMVAFLQDYEQSPGAQLEYQYCMYTDKTVVYFNPLGKMTFNDFYSRYDKMCDKYVDKGCKKCPIEFLCMTNSAHKIYADDEKYAEACKILFPEKGGK